MSGRLSDDHWARFIAAQEPPDLLSLDDEPPRFSAVALATDEAAHLALAEANKAAIRADLDSMRESPRRPHTALDGIRDLASAAVGEIRSFAESESSFVTVDAALLSTLFAVKPGAHAVATALPTVLERASHIAI